MDALVLSINGTRRIAAELQVKALASVGLFWIGSNNKYVFEVRVTRHDQSRLHRWDPIPLNLGDSISFTTTDVIEVDAPVESLTDAERLEQERNRPKMIPDPHRITPPFEIFGTLDLHVNNVQIASSQLNSEVISSTNFVWLDDRNGMSVIHLSKDLHPACEIPTVGYGDEVAFYTTRQW